MPAANSQHAIAVQVADLIPRDLEDLPVSPQLVHPVTHPVVAAIGRAVQESRDRNPLDLFVYELEIVIGALVEGPVKRLEAPQGSA
jgi:hypothetical protein